MPPPGAAPSRAIPVGSSVFTMRAGEAVAHELPVDELAIAAPLRRPIIGYD